MAPYLAVVCTRLDRGSLESARLPRERVAAVLGEYKYLAEAMASQYSSLHFTFTPDGYTFLFENPDPALQFGLRLIDSWKLHEEAAPEISDNLHLPIAVGCCFGECSQLQAGESWVGRGINLAAPVAEAAEPDSVFVTGSLLDVIDLPLYDFQEQGRWDLKGDQLGGRTLYRVTAFEATGPDVASDRPENEEAWLLKGLAFVGTQSENTEIEAQC